MSNLKKKQNGQDVDLTPEEIAQREIDEAAWIVELKKRQDDELRLKVQKIELENIGVIIDAVLSGDKSKLQEIKNQIVALKGTI